MRGWLNLCVGAMSERTRGDGEGGMEGGGGEGGGGEAG